MCLLRCMSSGVPWQLSLQQRVAKTHAVALNHCISGLKMLLQVFHEVHDSCENEYRITKGRSPGCKPPCQTLDSTPQSSSSPSYACVQVVVCTSSTLKEANGYDAFCRTQSPPIPFIYAKTAGVFGQVFCDFGPEFVIFDTNGAPLLPATPPKPWHSRLHASMKLS